MFVRIAKWYAVLILILTSLLILILLLDTHVWFGSRPRAVDISLGVALMLVPIISLIGVVVAFTHASLTAAQKYSTAALFLMPLWVVIIGSPIMTMAAPMIFTVDSAKRAEHEMKGLSFRPYLPPTTFTNNHDRQIRSIYASNGTFTIVYGNITATGADTSLFLSQTAVKSGGDGHYCRNYGASFTSPRGVKITKDDNRFCYLRGGVHIGMSVNEQTLRNAMDAEPEDNYETIVGEFVDALQPISPEGIAAYYSKN